jgi:hypothetical protein
VALAAARHASKGHDIGTVQDFARAAIDQAQELIFLDQLKFLAAGGRISRTQGFFGDLLRMKPVISPLPQGAVKVGVVRSRGIRPSPAAGSAALPGSAPLILLRTPTTARGSRRSPPRGCALLPGASILLQRLSPDLQRPHGTGHAGTVAFLPKPSTARHSERDSDVIISRPNLARVRFSSGQGARRVPTEAG